MWAGESAQEKVGEYDELDYNDPKLDDSDYEARLERLKKEYGIGDSDVKDMSAGKDSDIKKGHDTDRQKTQPKVADKKDNTSGKLPPTDLKLDTGKKEGDKAVSKKDEGKDVGKPLPLDPKPAGKLPLKQEDDMIKKPVDKKKNNLDDSDLGLDTPPKNPEKKPAPAPAPKDNPAPKQDVKKPKEDPFGLDKDGDDDDPFGDNTKSLPKNNTVSNSSKPQPKPDAKPQSKPDTKTQPKKKDDDPFGLDKDDDSDPFADSSKKKDPKPTTTTQTQPKPTTTSKPDVKPTVTTNPKPQPAAKKKDSFELDDF